MVNIRYYVYDENNLCMTLIELLIRHCGRLLERLVSISRWIQADGNDDLSTECVRKMYAWLVKTLNGNINLLKANPPLLPVTLKCNLLVVAI